MKVLVTGASGFLGKYVISELVNLNYEIETIGRSESSTIISDISEVVPVISSPYDFIIHIAGKAHIVPKTSKENQEFYDVNFRGTQNLLKSLEITPKSIVFISTVSVYGLDYGDNITEEAPLNAKDSYGKSKIQAEKLITEWGKSKNVTITILRLPLLFGINPPGNLKSMINAIHKRRYFNIGKGDVRKSMVFAKDVAMFIPKIVSIGGIYNLTDGHHPSFKELSDLISKHHNTLKPKIIPIDLARMIALIGDLIQKITKKPMPINKYRFNKMTKSLTFNDKKARAHGWQPYSILENPEIWL